MPDIQIDEENSVSDTQGWYTKETVETYQECTLRVKEVIRELKEWHKENPDQTILMISHGCFLRCLKCVLTVGGGNFEKDTY